MFCPVCESEYREGFTKCSDCGVDLVKQLVDDSEAKEPLWAGQDASVRSAICDKLDAAKIPHEDDFVESQFMPHFVSPSTGFRSAKRIMKQRSKQSAMYTWTNRISASHRVWFSIAILICFAPL
jgi:hypothetical protein